MVHNRVISTQATAWLKKNDSQTTICKLFCTYHMLSRGGPCKALRQIPEANYMPRKVLTDNNDKL